MRNGGKLVICNLQKNPLDDYAKLRVFAKTDVLMEKVRVQDLRKVEAPLLWLQRPKSSTEEPYKAMPFGRIVVFDMVLSGAAFLVPLALALELLTLCGLQSGSGIAHSGLAWLPLPTCYFRFMLYQRLPVVLVAFARTRIPSFLEDRIEFLTGPRVQKSPL